MLAASGAIWQGALAWRRLWKHAGVLIRTNSFSTKKARRRPPDQRRRCTHARSVYVCREPNMLPHGARFSGKLYVCTYVRMYLHMYICMRVRTPTYIVDLQPAHHRATHPPVWSSPATPCRLRAPSPSSHWPPRLVSSPHSPWLARDAHARRSTELARRVARRKANVRRLSLLF